MSRLQTKCIFGSLFFHGTLILILVVGSAFVNPKPKEQAVKFANIFIPAEITDSETQGGGNPNAPSVDPGPPAQAATAAEPAPVSQAPVEPIAAPPAVKQTPVEVPSMPKARAPVEPPKTPVKTPPKKPDQKKTDLTKKPKDIVPPKTPKKPETKVAEVKKETPPLKPTTEKIKPDLSKVMVAKADPDWQRRREEQAKKIEQQRKAAEEARREAQLAHDRAERAAQEDYAAAQQAYLTAVANATRLSREAAAANAAAVANAANALRTGLSAASVIEMPGPGGKAFINYTEFIFTRYYEAWQTPQSSGGADSVKVEIVVARSGKVISSRIIDKSGDAALDRSVREALSRVPNLPPFPAGTADETRTFKINFTLEAKRTFG